jgi:hypothetical protein
MQLVFSRTSESAFRTGQARMADLMLSALRIMTPDPLPTNRGSELPIRLRPDLSDVVQGAVEHDFWSMEETNPALPELPAARLKVPVTMLPASEELEKPKVRQLMDTTSLESKETEIVTKVSVKKLRTPLGPSAMGGLKKPGQDFDDLDSWGETPPEPLVITIGPNLRPTPEIQPTDAPVQVAAATKQGEISPTAQRDPGPQRTLSRMNLSILERCGLLLLLGLLGAGGVAVYFFTVHRLPSESGFTKSNSFPLQGQHLSVLAAASYWRAPNASDTARRGTVLLPVLTLKSSGGSAAIRVFFRNSEGELVGDAVTQSTKDGGELEIPATAGFDDRGMHAAYRTGQGPPWTVEVWEAPSGKSTTADFKKLLTMPVSTVCR